MDDIVGVPETIGTGSVYLGIKCKIDINKLHLSMF
jgi:hypothetical protein